MEKEKKIQNILLRRKKSFGIFKETRMHKIKIYVFCWKITQITILFIKRKNRVLECNREIYEKKNENQQVKIVFYRKNVFQESRNRCVIKKVCDISQPTPMYFSLPWNNLWKCLRLIDHFNVLFEIFSMGFPIMDLIYLNEKIQLITLSKCWVKYCISIEQKQFTEFSVVTLHFCNK